MKDGKEGRRKEGREGGRGRDMRKRARASNTFR